jgi:hypothetical protein
LQAQQSNKLLIEDTYKMRLKTSLLLATVIPSIFVLIGQQPASTGTFTAAQAEAGRAAYERTCGKCHTSTLLGRTGDKSELPPISSLSAPYQKFIGSRGFVPPLAGKVFIDRWGAKTAGQLIARFEETAYDPFFQFEDIKDETTVDITAYVLQVNGAKAGSEPLTIRSAAIVSSITH